MNVLFDARLNHLMLCYPEELKRKFQDNRSLLFREIVESINPSIKHAKELKAKGYTTDQIAEIVDQMVAPLDVPEAEEHLSESFQARMMRWANNPPERK